jgi:hypothetical protein
MINFIKNILVKQMYVALRDQSEQHLKKQGHTILRAFENSNVGDFYMEMRWDFHSWSK